MNNSKYKMSFTAGSLLRYESEKLALLYLDCKDWTIVKDKVISENILQARTMGTSKRICREVIDRLKTLSISELEFLSVASLQEQGYILWIAICRLYVFIAEFATEVLREKFLTFQYEVTYSDFDAFFNGKAAWYEELDGISNTTLAKLRQVLFKIMHESEILNDTNMMNRIMLTPEIVKVVGIHSISDFSFFPIAEADVKRLV